MARTKKDFDKEALYKKLMPTNFGTSSKNSTLLPVDTTPVAIEPPQSVSEPVIGKMPSIKQQTPPTAQKKIPIEMSKPSSTPQTIPKMPPRAPTPIIQETKPKPSPIRIQPQALKSPHLPTSTPVSKMPQPTQTAQVTETVVEASPAIQDANAFCEKIPIIIQKFQEEELVEGVVPNVGWVNNEYETAKRLHKEVPIPRAADIAAKKWKEEEWVVQETAWQAEEPYSSGVTPLTARGGYYPEVAPKVALEEYYAKEPVVPQQQDYRWEVATHSTLPEEFYTEVSCSQDLQYEQSHNQVQYEEDNMNETTFTYPVETFVKQVQSAPQKILVHNAMEDLVIHCIYVDAREYVTCACEQCISDISAIALNELPPKYIAATQEEMVEKTLQFVQTTDFDVSTQVAKAILKVKQSPRH